MKVPKELAAAWNNVRDDKTTACWMIAEPNKQATDCSLAAKGKTGWDDFISNFAVDKVYFGGFRVRAVDDRGSTKSVRTKFIMVSWIGPKVSPLQRAKAGTLQTEFKSKLFEGAFIAVQCSDKEDLDIPAMIKSLDSATGAHKPTGYEFDGNEGQEGLVDKEDGAEVGGSTGDTGATGGTVAPAPASPKSSTPAGNADGTAKQAWQAVQADQGRGNPLNWIILSYDGKDPKSAKVAKKGYGGLQEFIDAIADDAEVYFGGLKVKGYNETGALFMKYVFVNWIGPKVKAMQRAKVSGHKSDFEKLLEGCHIRVAATEKSDIEQKDLEGQMARAMNRPPKTWDWSGSSEEEAAAAKAAEPPGDAAATGETGPTLPNDEAAEAKEKAAKEKAEKEKAEKEKAEKEKAEKEKAEKEKAEKEKAEKEKADKEKADKEKAEKEKAAKEKAEKEEKDRKEAAAEEEEKKKAEEAAGKAEKEEEEKAEAGKAEKEAEDAQKKEEEAKKEQEAKEAKEKKEQEEKEAKEKKEKEAKEKEEKEAKEKKEREAKEKKEKEEKEQKEAKEAKEKEAKEKQQKEDKEAKEAKEEEPKKKDAAKVETTEPAGGWAESKGAWELQGAVAAMAKEDGWEAAAKLITESLMKEAGGDKAEVREAMKNAMIALAKKKGGPASPKKGS